MEQINEGENTTIQMQASTEAPQQKRFNIKYEAKLIMALSKLFKAPGEAITENQAINMSECALMSACNIFMIIAKSEEAKRLLSRFIEKEGRVSKCPSLKFETNLEVRGKYNIDILSKMLKVLDVCEETVIIKMANDFPVLLESEHFNFVLAPRIDN